LIFPRNESRFLRFTEPNLEEAGESPFVVVDEGEAEDEDGKRCLTGVEGALGAEAAGGGVVLPLVVGAADIVSSLTPLRAGEAGTDGIGVDSAGAGTGAVRAASETGVLASRAAGISGVVVSSFFTSGTTSSTAGTAVGSSALTASTTGAGTTVGAAFSSTTGSVTFGASSAGGAGSSVAVVSTVASSTTVGAASSPTGTVEWVEGSSTLSRTGSARTGVVGSSTGSSGAVGSWMVGSGAFSFSVSGGGSGVAKTVSGGGDLGIVLFSGALTGTIMIGTIGATGEDADSSTISALSCPGITNWPSGFGVGIAI